MNNFNKSNGIKLKAKFLGLVLIGISFFSLTLPAYSFTPYIYEPNPEELKKTGISIGKTAAQLLHLGQNKEAEKLALLAVQIQPNDDRLWSILAEAQVRNNNITAAIKSIRKAKDINPKKASLWFAEASLELQKNEIGNAIKLLSQGLIFNPKNEIAYFQLGNARIMENNLNLALKAFERAITLKPNFWEAKNNKGIVLFELDKTNKAILEWESVLTITENAEPMLALAAALNQINNQNLKAIKLAKTALTKNPNYILTTYQKEQLWGKKLQAAAQNLLSNPKLAQIVAEARANSSVNTTNTHDQ